MKTKNLKIEITVISIILVFATALSLIIAPEGSLRVINQILLAALRPCRVANRHFLL